MELPGMTQILQTTQSCRIYNQHVCHSFNAVYPKLVIRSRVYFQIPCLPIQIQTQTDVTEQIQIQEKLIFVFAASIHN